MMPLGIRCKAVLTPLMTSVWPALWPPWKRTTPCAFGQPIHQLALAFVTPLGSYDNDVASGSW